jgi:hypothetical protein
VDVEASKEIRQSPMEPIVRYMILCEHARVDPNRPHCIQIDCLMNSITSLEDPAYPLLRESIWFALVLTACRGKGLMQIRVAFVDDENEELVFGTPPRLLDFAGRDPLNAVGMVFEIRNCPFPRPGRYSAQFWYNDRCVFEQPLTLR